MHACTQKLVKIHNTCLLISIDTIHGVRVGWGFEVPLNNLYFEHYLSLILWLFWGIWTWGRPLLKAPSLPLALPPELTSRVAVVPK